MGFLKRLFSGGGEKKYVDDKGIYFYVKSDPGAVVKVRADRQHDLNRTNSGYIWHKTIVDNRYFSRMQAIVHFDHNYQITNRELTGGKFISEDEYEAMLRADKSEENEDSEE